jgi:hypothetical protein
MAVMSQQDPLGRDHMRANYNSPGLPSPTTKVQ